MRLIACLVLFTSLIGCAEFIGRSQPVVGSSSESKTVYVASDDIIRIVTPFADPRVVTVSDADIERSQHVLYVLLEGDEEVSMFVTEAENEGSSISLTLKPKEGGVREINAASISSTLIRAASSPSIPAKVSKTPAKVPQPEAAKAAKRTPALWDADCRHCSTDDDDDYSSPSW